MLNNKEIGLFVAALATFIIFYKRILRLDGDKPEKPGIIIISVLMIIGVCKANLPFLQKHSGDILSIVVCMLALLVFMDLYESSTGLDSSSSLRQIFIIEPDGTVTPQ